MICTLSDPKIKGSYPEVTGYIIPSLFDFSRNFNEHRAFDSAIRASDFLIPFQDRDGHFPGGFVGNLSGPSVFNSAQIVHGLVRTYAETGEKKYIDSAIRACDWICSVQEEDGAWGKFNYLGLKRVYDSKVCQALLEAGKAKDTDEYIPYVERNLNFIRKNQITNGWFMNCDNSVEGNDAPLTHTIGYAVHGLLEGYLLMQRDDLLEAATLSLHSMMHRFELDGRPLRGRLLSDWGPAVSSTCVTGDAQISICWMKLFKISGDFRYLNAALKMNDFLKRIQFDCGHQLIDGSLPASYPVWGDYLPYCVNSWGVKYFLDALMMEYEIKSELLREQR